MEVTVIADLRRVCEGDRALGHTKSLLENHDVLDLIDAVSAGSVPASSPDKDSDQAALLALFNAYQRLKALGWNDAIYCPKDGTHFDAIEVGSTGIHDCSYEGRWPDGCWWVYDGDVWPSRPVLFRLRAGRVSPPALPKE